MWLSTNVAVLCDFWRQNVKCEMCEEYGVEKGRERIGKVRKTKM